jgi:hypothetical protein
MNPEHRGQREQAMGNEEERIELACLSAQMIVE